MDSMAPHLMPGLTPTAASDICIHQCGAMCCRGPSILRLSSEELKVFEEHARGWDIKLVASNNADGGTWLRFTDHPGDHCPMLDAATSRCRIYEDRPERCRHFPERLIPGCAISGGGFGDRHPVNPQDPSP